MFMKEYASMFSKIDIKKKCKPYLWRSPMGYYTSPRNTNLAKINVSRLKKFQMNPALNRSLRKQYSPCLQNNIMGWPTIIHMITNHKKNIEDLCKHLRISFFRWNLRLFYFVSCQFHDYSNKERIFLYIQMI